MAHKWIVCAGLFIVSTIPASHAASVRSVKGTSPQSRHASQVFDIRIPFELVNQSRCFQVECLAPIGSNLTVSSQRRSVDQDKALTTLFAGQMEFSLDLFKAMVESGQTSTGHLKKGASGNVFFSPMSVYSALLLAYFGSSNRTEAQLADVLGFRDVDKVTKADVATFACNCVNAEVAYAVPPFAFFSVHNVTAFL